MRKLLPARMSAAEKQFLQQCHSVFTRDDGLWGEKDDLAARLLWRNLDEKQRRDVLNHSQGRHCFVVTGGGPSAPRREYRMSWWGAVCGHCIRPAWPLPWCDRALAIKLWIETNERTFLIVANSYTNTTRVLTPNRDYLPQPKTRSLHA